MDEGRPKPPPPPPAASPDESRFSASNAEFTQPAQARQQNTLPHQAAVPASPSVPAPQPQPSQPPAQQPPPYPAQRPLHQGQAYVPPPPPPQVARPAPYATPRRAAPRQNWSLVAAAMMILVIAVVGSIGLFVVLRFAVNNRDVALDVTTTPEATQAAVALVPPTLAPTPTVGLDILPWDGQRRLTILLMGLDKRPGEKGSAFRSDSMMLVSINPKNKTVGILSIPRDLFIEIPRDSVVGSYGLQRVNAAYALGELAKPGYGATLAVQTVQYNLGIRINNYVVFEFGTVTYGVDVIGGIDINVLQNIYDPQYPNMYYGYDPLYIKAGLTHMNGALALKYARTRHQTSDFDRVKRQQDVLMAVREKILKNNMVPELVIKAPEIWNKVSSTTKSDLSLDQMIRLGLYVKDIPKENIKQGSIEPQYVTSQMYQGQSILVPERVKLGPLLQQIFGPDYNN